MNKRKKTKNSKAMKKILQFSSFKFNANLKLVKKNNDHLFDCLF